MPSYNVSQIIGATLYAKRPISIKAIPEDGAPVIRQIPVGQPVGVVFSYLMPNANRSSMYWMFYDAQGNAYYSVHNSSWYELEGEGELYPDLVETPWWENLFSGGANFGSNISNYIVLGGLVYLGVRYGPEWVKSLKKK